MIRDLSIGMGAIPKPRPRRRSASATKRAFHEDVGAPDLKG